MVDCLLIGFNDISFVEYHDTVKSMGIDSGAYRDLRLHFIEYNGRPYRSVDILNHFYFGGNDKAAGFHNSDLLWPVITYLGTYLHKSGFSFDYVNLFHLEREKLKEKLIKNDIRTIVITTTLYVSPQPIFEIVSFIKKYNKTAKIIIGGPYISNQSKIGDTATLLEIFNYLGGDIYVISSEGEFALVNILQTLKNGGSLNSVNNIAYKNGETFITTLPFLEINALEENFTDYSLFAREEMGEFVTTRTAKSCPFSCAFCSFPQRAGKYTYLSVEMVEKEFNAINDLDCISTVTIIDDTFNVPKQRFKELLKMMICNKYDFKWNSFYRCDHGDEEIIELMGQAGCEGVLLGVESGSDFMLERIRKSARRKDYLKYIPMLKDAGILTHANLFVGFPGETYETVQESISLLQEAQPDTFKIQLWYCDTTTPVWNKKDEYGIEGQAFNWSHNTMDYETACNLVEQVFLSVTNSVWLPQNGWEQWMMFYLQRKGMKLEQIMTFLNSFSAILKDQILYPKKEEIDPQLLESLRRSAQFNKSGQSSSIPIEIRSNSNYIAAE